MNQIIRVSARAFAARYMKLATQKDDAGIPYYVQDSSVYRVEIIDPPCDWVAYLDALPTIPVWSLGLKPKCKARPVKPYTPESKPVKFKNKRKNSAWDLQILKP
jgi:hypothetical protein